MAYCEWVVLPLCQGDYLEMSEVFSQGTLPNLSLQPSLTVPDGGDNVRVRLSVAAVCDDGVGADDLAAAGRAAAAASAAAVAAAAAEASRRHSSLSDAPIESNVLRKVASLTLDRATLDQKLSKPKFVPEKLDFQIYEKFEGELLGCGLLGPYLTNRAQVIQCQLPHRKRSI